MSIENIGVVSSNRLIDLIISSWYVVWVGASGYDARPYIPAIGRGAKLPCNYEEGYAENGIEGYVVEVEKEEIKATVEGLKSSMNAIVIPDYYGMNHEGDYVYTPTGKGWRVEYISY